MKKQMKFIIGATGPMRWLLIQLLVLTIVLKDRLFNELWIYIVVVTAGTILNTVWLAMKTNNLTEHRATVGTNTKAWDKVLLVSYFLLNLIIMPLMIGLDITTFHLTRIPSILQYIFIPVYFFAMWFLLKVMQENPFFEGTARIQDDRKQKVISTGLYRVIRHPGYLAMIIGEIAVPIIAKSLLGLYVSIIPIIILLIRTHLEDQMLIKELEGYMDYTKKTKSRLIPFIW